MTLHVLRRTGAIAEATLTIKPGDDLAEKTGRADYQGFVVDEINWGAGFVRFANNVEVKKGAEVGTEKDAIFEAQIRYTVEEHFRKQARYRERGIKVLSLFFIDKVENYASENGLIRKLFIKAFNEAKSGFADWRNVQPMAAQASYFASKTRRGGEVEFLDTSGRTKEDEAAFDLIMRDKERLLSFDEPVSFIFCTRRRAKAGTTRMFFRFARCARLAPRPSAASRSDAACGCRWINPATGCRTRRSTCSQWLRARATSVSWPACKAKSRRLMAPKACRRSRPTRASARISHCASTICSSRNSSRYGTRSSTKRNTR